MPEESEDQAAFFSPDLSGLRKKTKRQFLENQAALLRRFLIHRSPIMPVGVLRFCLEYAGKDEEAPSGILAAVRERFSHLTESDLRDLLGSVYDFRNTYIAHSKGELDERAKAEAALHSWIEAIQRLSAVAAAEAARAA